MCRNVHVPRPRASTSAGQSIGRRAAEAFAVMDGVLRAVDGDVLLDIICIQADEEVQERQLYIGFTL